MDALQVLFDHQTCRNFKDQCLTAEQVNNIKRACAQTSSACFYQVCTVIRVTDRKLLEQIGALSGGTMKIAHAPEFWVFCADFTRLRRIAQLPDLIPFPMFFHAVNDCSLACQNALTAAEAQGLGGVIIGGFKAQIVKISALLQIPRYAAPVLGLALGVPDEAYREEQKPRLPMEWLFTDNTYHDGFNADDFAAYNERYREYTAQRKYNNEPKTWSEACLAMLSRKNPQSDKLAAFYQAQGFAIGD